VYGDVEEYLHVFFTSEPTGQLLASTAYTHKKNLSETIGYEA
jgi:hypothetical protein